MDEGGRNHKEDEEVDGIRGRRPIGGRHELPYDYTIKALEVEHSSYSDHWTRPDEFCVQKYLRLSKDEVSSVRVSPSSSWSLSHSHPDEDSTAMITGDNRKEEKHHCVPPLNDRDHCNQQQTEVKIRRNDIRSPSLHDSPLFHPMLPYFYQSGFYLGSAHSFPLQMLLQSQYSSTVSYQGTSPQSLESRLASLHPNSGGLIFGGPLDFGNWLQASYNAAAAATAFTISGLRRDDHLLPSIGGTCSPTVHHLGPLFSPTSGASHRFTPYRLPVKTNLLDDPTSPEVLSFASGLGGGGGEEERGGGGASVSPMSTDMRRYVYPSGPSCPLMMTTIAKAASTSAEPNISAAIPNNNELKNME